MNRSTPADGKSALIPAPKINYLDHIKVLLTILVILHHTFITYGAPGGWYYKQPTTNPIALIPMTLFVATNQSFFMGMFFMLSAYFVEPSCQRKGPAIFRKDRLKRLGIPLLFYSFVLSPCMNFLIYRFGLHKQATFIQYLTGYDDWIDFGVLWFVAALLLFTLIYLALRPLVRLSGRSILPPMSTIVLFAIGLGLTTFLVRLVFPVGWVLHPIGFQLGHFPQYITFFILGLLARQQHWLDQLNLAMGKRFGWLAGFLVLLVFPLIFLGSIQLKTPIAHFNGGWHWPSLVYSVWEQLTGLSIIIALLSISQVKWNETSVVLARGARNSFAVYILHPLVIIVLSLMLSGASFDPLLKLALVAPLAVAGSFLLAGGVLRLPNVSKVV